MLRAQADEITFRRIVAKDVLQTRQRSLSHFPRLDVERLSQPREGLIVLGGELLQRLHRQLADVGLIDLQRKIEWFEGRLAEMFTQTLERLDTDRLIVVIEPLLQELRGARVAARGQQLGTVQ